MGGRPKYLKSYTDITGRQRHYVRRKGFQEIPIHAEIGTPEFDRQYHLALSSLPARSPRAMTPIVPDEFRDGRRGAYFVEAAGLIKIGYSRNVFLRMIDLQIGCPVVMRLLHVVDGGPETEVALHLKFAAYRRHGEWFEPASEIMDFIESREQIEMQNV